MAHEAKIHEAQTKILRDLLFVKSLRFADLVTVTGLEADHAKFHIKRLVELGYLDRKSGKYALSVKGKEYANKLDTDDNTIERQPKSTCFLILHDTKTGKVLLQERLKNPYYGFWGFYTGKVKWGESIYETAVRETLEETGLVTSPKDWKHRGIYHEIVKHEETGEIVEDKIFHAMYCEEFSGKLMEKFEGGRNFWATTEERRAYPKTYKSIEVEERAVKRNIGFVERVDTYGADEF
ncbi:NUDIX domain-containing protein [Candidatus Saccharibacteria bacterium]|nr:NUDIX domain-containing protein [Candidatus Saccharibacteria bacterium]